MNMRETKIIKTETFGLNKDFGEHFFQVMKVVLLVCLIIANLSAWGF
jgi:hypothetical protein